VSLRRHTAAEFNLKALFATVRGKRYMWTLTFPFFARPEAVREMVRVMIRWLREHGATGVRVYEQHKSGGLHIHICMDKFFTCGRIRGVWRNLGGGRIHRKTLHDSDNGNYICKELMKPSQKRGFQKGTRVYAAFGDGWDTIGKSLIGNIEFVGLDRFNTYLRGRGERHHDVVGFNFGLEYFACETRNVDGLLNWEMAQKTRQRARGEVANV